MKFGQNLHRHQVVEWTPSYIDYQALKQSYKRAQKHAPDHGEDIDLRGLPFNTLTLRELILSKISGFCWPRISQNAEPSMKCSMRSLH